MNFIKKYLGRGIQIEDTIKVSDKSKPSSVPGVSA